MNSTKIAPAREADHERPLNKTGASFCVLL